MQHIILSDGWQLQRHEPTANRTDDSQPNGWLPATVPGTVHLDLLAAGVIPDPFVGTHEQDIQWVGESDWLYRCRFDLLPDFIAQPTIALCCDGLDTFAIVWLNGHQVLQSDSMFVPQRVPVTSLLREGTNELQILFESAWHRGKQREVEYGQLHVWNTDPSRVYVRKAQYHYGWDWGPCLVTAGPWQPIRLEAYTARIADVHCPVDVSDDLTVALIPVSVRLEQADEHMAMDVRLELIDPSGTLVSQTTARVSDNMVRHTFSVPQPQLWWPHTHGAQPLYRVVATLVAAHADASVLDQRELSTGMRRLRLLQEPLLDAPGTSFVFEINNTPLFCGGANWIPADSFTPRIGEEQYRALLTQAVEAHMVMVRVWGGGIYEDEIFYNLCDELGLLVWQDFMFACGVYPAHDAFQCSVRAEAVAQVRRLRHHPSIVLWCGNNEDYQLANSLGLYDHAIPPTANPAFPARVIYEELLPAVCGGLDGTRPYRPGSPFGGPDANDSTNGDRHTWDVWHGAMAPYQEYTRFGGRFISEFGMAAFPSPATIAVFASPEEQHVGSRTLVHHHKPIDGDMRLNTYLAANTGVPDDLAAYIYATQFVQAEAMTAAFSGWRRSWGQDHSRVTAGALVWQLDDCWPTISWSLIDYALRPKPALYAVRRALAPFAVGLARSQDGVEAWVVNGQLTSIEAELDVDIWSFGGECEAHTQQRLTLPPNGVIELGRLNMVVGDHQIVSARLRMGGTVVARIVMWPEPFKQYTLSDPQVEIVKLGEDRLLLRVARPAKGVWLHAADHVRWSDNMLDLMPNDPQMIVAQGLGDLPVHVQRLILS